MKMTFSALIFVLVVVGGLVTDRPLSASIAGTTSVSTEYNAEVRGGNGEELYRFNVAIEPVMFRLQTIQGKYRLVRLRIWNATTSPMTLSAERDRLEVVPRGAAPVAAVLNPQRLDPTFWDALDSRTRETLAYPVALRGTPAAAGGAGRPSPESVYVYLLVPAAISDVPESFRYTIASLNQVIVIRTGRQMAA